MPVSDYPDEAAADTKARHAHREQFLIEKRGVYYRPEAKGYTGLKREAGRYSFEEAAERVGPNGPDGSQDGLSMWREEEAPEYSSACYSDTRAWEEGRKKGAADAAAEIERLTALLEEATTALETCNRNTQGLSSETFAFHCSIAAHASREALSRIKEPRNDQ